MIHASDGLFVLNTDHTSYAFAVSEHHLLEHLHYGERLGDACNAKELIRALSQKVSHGKGTTVDYATDSHIVTEDLPQEISSCGKGDFREPALVLSYADGSRTSDFLFDSYEVKDGASPMQTLPCAVSAGDDQVSQLIVHLKERCRGVRLDLIYTVFPSCDVITRRCVLANESEERVIIHKLMSTQLDLRPGSYRKITFGGNWGREMELHETALTHGLHVNHTTTGVSSNRNNPFVMIASRETSETAGACYACNLVYSGNHYEACEIGGFYGLRFVAGIDPTQFCWELQKGEVFETPEAVMTYSVNGFSGISQAMHAFVRKHIIRGAFRDQPRPILLNSWEAAYFHINEFKLLRLAKKAAEAGIELLVMDDGWFKGRDSDRTSLGDWVADSKKLPGGIRRLSKKVHDLGLQFGIWVEPEMISEDSDLYRAHPEYAMQIPGRVQSLGRNQMILDLTNPEVVAYVKDAMRNVFSDNGIKYGYAELKTASGDLILLPGENRVYADVQTEVDVQMMEYTIEVSTPFVPVQ